jgi:hypothetical protein
MVIPGWQSADSAENIGHRLEFWGIIVLAVVVIFDYFAWLLFGIDRTIQLWSIIALACLVMLESVAWGYGDRAKRLRKIETARQEEAAKEANIKQEARISAAQEIAARAVKNSDQATERISGLEYSQIPMRLDVGQTARLMHTIRKYTRQKISIRYAPGDEAAKTFADSLFAEFFAFPSWDVIGFKEWDPIPLWNPVGVSVALNANDYYRLFGPENKKIAGDNDFGRAAEDLVEIFPGGKLAMAPNDWPSGVIYLIVGKKPPLDEIVS